jgi:signal recognition particle receptor subunit beta
VDGSDPGATGQAWVLLLEALVDTFVKPLPLAVVLTKTDISDRTTIETIKNVMRLDELANMWTADVKVFTGSATNYVLAELLVKWLEGLQSADMERK